MNVGKENRSLIIVGAFIGGITVLRLLPIAFPQGTGTVDPHVTIPENQLSAVRDTQLRQQVTAFNSVIDGEVSRTEERIREATALATAASLFAANQTLNRHLPTDAAELLAGLNSAGLIPPGQHLVNSDGQVGGIHGSLFLRYRREPLGVEVISLGSVRLDGPALLVRTQRGDLTRGSQECAGLYVATKLDQLTLPTPFVSEAELLGLGFVSEPLRAAKLPKPEVTK